MARKIWQLENYNEQTRWKLKMIANQQSLLLGRTVTIPEALTIVTDHYLHDFPISVERIPADRRAGASYLRNEKRKQSGTSQGHKTQANPAVTPLRPQAD